MQIYTLVTHSLNYLQDFIFKEKYIILVTPIIIIMDETYIYQQLFSLVQTLFQNHPLQNYYGIHLSMKVLKHVNDCIVMESYKKQRNSFILRCSAILCSLPLFFSSKDIRKCLYSIFPKNNNRLIKDISSVISTIHPLVPKKNMGNEWMLVSRYAFQLEQIGMEGGLRAYYFQNYKSSKKENPISFLSDQRKKIKQYADELEKSNIPCMVSSARDRFQQMEPVLKNSSFLEICKL
jgi:hypothetical protein